jgi:spore germination cell wall hydrolase CwlJ-like protein
MKDYTIVLPAQVKPFTDLMMVALTVWREASGEATIAKQAVAWAIRNRVDRPGWWGKDWVDVVTHPSQFTSMVPPAQLADANLRRWPRPEDPSWSDALHAAFDVICSNVPDPTGGATFYHSYPIDSPKVPLWAKTYKHVADVGAFHFYKP